MCNALSKMKTYKELQGLCRSLPLVRMPSFVILYAVGHNIQNAHFQLSVLTFANDVIFKFAFVCDFYEEKHASTLEQA